LSDLSVKNKNGTGSGIANKAALLSGGKIVFEQSKMLLPTYDVFDESRYFQPAAEQKVFGFAGKCWASQFAKTSGTTKIFGR